MSPDRNALKKARRWVVKIGSALLTDDGRGLDVAMMSAWVAQMAELRAKGIEIVLVSSGSVAEGIKRLGWMSRPHEVHKLQAAAAVGQMGLVQAWESCFQRHDQHTAQVLLVHEDLSDRRRYLNARSALQSLIELGVVPVINENDTVATDELRFGDNDTLAGLVANLIEADLQVILTDQPGLFDRDPREHADAQLVNSGRAGDPALEAMASSRGGNLGRGGMVTKLRSARLAARSGTHTVIADGRLENVLGSIAAGENTGTLLFASEQPLAARKQWLAGQLQTQGTLVLDEGAVKVLRNSGRSLLPVGVREVRGEFTRGDLVSCIAEDGVEVARGLVNYGAEESQRIIGLPSSRIEEVLGYLEDEELIHRDNLVLHSLD